MEKRQKRLAASLVFGIVIAYSVHAGGRGWGVALGAGVLGGAVYYLVSRFVIDQNP